VSATHPVLVGAAEERLAEAPISKLIVSDTIPLGDRCLRVHDRFTQLSVSQVLGDAIERIHNHKSVSALFQRDENQY
ncbi:MAG: ribose-phosphate diphosphokinase, partial [Phycisphaeraceae bacterium]|nr:ribose-phosphate diphosphokinase [Phycisphaeraceae bacterium]